MVAELRVRSATSRDGPVLHAHWARVIMRWGVRARERDAHVRAYARWLARERRRRRIHALVAEVAGGAAASAVVWLQERQPRPGFDGGPVPRLLYVHVEPEAADAGVAEALLARIASWCRSHGHDTLQTHAGGGDQHVLDRLGFKRTNEFWLAKPPLRIP
jgi:GNAT superfamily N-acetyltransferase